MPRDGFARHRCGEPPRVHAPCIGRVTGAGRSPDSRVLAFLPPSRGFHRSGIVEERSPLTVAGAVPGSIRRTWLTSPDSLLAGPPGDGTPVPQWSGGGGRDGVNGVVMAPSIF